MSLSKRLENLKTGSYADPLQEFMKLSWTEMCNCKIDFGKAHAGKSYLTAWHMEPTWVRWIVKTYESSEKPEHRRFLKFVEMMIEMEEKGMTPTSIEQHELQAPIGPTPSMMRAKAKAMPRVTEGMEPSPDMMVHLSETASVEDWIDMNSMPNTTENIEALQARMSNVENALTEILSHLRQEPK